MPITDGVTKMEKIGTIYIGSIRINDGLVEVEATKNVSINERGRFDQSGVLVVMTSEQFGQSFIQTIEAAFEA